MVWLLVRFDLVGLVTVSSSHLGWKRTLKMRAIFQRVADYLEEMSLHMASAGRQPSREIQKAMKEKKRCLCHLYHFLDPAGMLRRGMKAFTPSLC